MSVEICTPGGQATNHIWKEEKKSSLVAFFFFLQARNSDLLICCCKKALVDVHNEAVHRVEIWGRGWFLNLKYKIAWGEIFCAYMMNV